MRDRDDDSLSLLSCDNDNYSIDSDTAFRDSGAAATVGGRFRSRHHDTSSVGSQGSWGSVGSVRSLSTTRGAAALYEVTDEGRRSVLTLRELITDIERKARGGGGAPEYVQSLEALPVNSYSWSNKRHKVPRKKKTPRKQHVVAKQSGAVSKDDNGDSRSVGSIGNKSLSSSLSSLESGSVINNAKTMVAMLQRHNDNYNNKNNNGSRIVVNIIGCHHPVNLILAKADERIRKQQAALQLKLARESDYNKSLVESIQGKAERQESMRRMRIKLQFQRAWSVLVAQCALLNALWNFRNETLYPRRECLRMNTAASVITKRFKKWYLARMKQKYRFRFKKSLRNNQFRLGISMRIVRRRAAVRKIKAFLVAMTQQKNSQIVFRNFHAKVRRAQRVARDFLACKRARIAVLSQVWDRWERIYIKKKLDERNPSRAMAKKAGVDPLLALNVNPKLKIEFEKQNEKWKFVEERMKAEMQRNEDRGNLTLLSDAQEIDKYLLPSIVKRAAISKLIMIARRKHYLAQSGINSGLAANVDFVADDAMHLLRGTKGYMDRRVRENFFVKSMGQTKKAKIFAPFVMHKSIRDRDIVEALKECHERAGTFVIKVTWDALKRRNERKKRTGVLDLKTQLKDEGGLAALLDEAKSMGVSFFSDGDGDVFNNEKEARKFVAKKFVSSAQRETKMVMRSLPTIEQLKKEN